MQHHHLGICETAKQQLLVAIKISQSFQQLLSMSPLVPRLSITGAARGAGKKSSIPVTVGTKMWETANACKHPTDSKGLFPWLHFSRMFLGHLLPYEALPGLV